MTDKMFHHVIIQHETFPENCMFLHVYVHTFDYCKVAFTLKHLEKNVFEIIYSVHRIAVFTQICFSMLETDTCISTKRQHRYSRECRAYFNARQSKNHVPNTKSQCSHRFASLC